MFTSLVLVILGLILVNRTFQSSLPQAFTRPNKSLWVLLSAAAALNLLLLETLKAYWFRDSRQPA